MRARWRVMLDGARDEALLAVDLYNQPRQPRRFEAFFVHMHMAWLYLLHAEFTRDGKDFRYRLPNGWFDRVDGEPKTWELAKCVAERWPPESPVRVNLELTIALRNKIEHRYYEAAELAITGYAQALLINFEEELTSKMGSEMSLGNMLRFPIFVGSVTPLGQAKLDQLRDQLPKDTRDFIAAFEGGLDAAIVDNPQYEFRVNLVPKLSSKGEADHSISFVRESDITDEQRKVFSELGKTGKVVVREQIRQVVGAGLLRPTAAASQIQEQIPFVFNLNHFVKAWKKLECRPDTKSKTPERTDERYCIYDEPYSGYLYKNAFVNKVVRETATASKFKKFLDTEPAQKSPDS